MPRRPLQPLDDGAHLHPHLVAFELALPVRDLRQHAARAARQTVTPPQREPTRIELDDLRQPRVLASQARQQPPARRPTQEAQVRGQHHLQLVERGLVVAVSIERLPAHHEGAFEWRKPLT